MKIGAMKLRLARRQKALQGWNPRESKVASRKASGGYKMPGSPKQGG